MKRIRKYLITGVVTLLPLIITVYVTKFIFEIIDGFLEPLIIIRFGKPVPGIGFLFTLAIILFTGLVMSNLFGRTVIAWLENLMIKIPLLNTIYTSVKMVIEAFKMQNKGSFQRVALIEYPRKGMYALGFVTSEGVGEVQAKTKQHVLSIFVPTTPNPTSGMLLLVPKDDVIMLDMSVEEGLKLVVSGGVICPKYNNEGAQ